MQIDPYDDEDEGVNHFDQFDSETIEVTEPVRTSPFVDELEGDELFQGAWRKLRQKNAQEASQVDSEKSLAIAKDDGGVTELYRRGELLQQGYSIDLQKDIEQQKIHDAKGIEERSKGLTDASKGFTQGILGMGSMLGAGLRQHGESFGSDTLTRVGEFVQYLSEHERAKVAPPRVNQFADVEGWNDFNDYFWGKLGEGMGSTSGIIAGGAVAGLPGIAATTMTMGMGEVRNELESVGVTDEKLLERYTYIGGSVVGALDTIVPVAVMKALTGNVRKELGKYMVRRVAVELGKSAGREGITEAMQEGVVIASAASAKGEQEAVEMLRNMKDALISTKNLKRMGEAGLGGAIGGVGFGTISATANEVRGQRPQAEKKPEPSDDPFSDIFRMAPIKTTELKNREAAAKKEAETAGPERIRTAPTAAETKKDKGVTVLQFIKNAGGLQPTGELAGIEAGRYPGLVSKKGLPADKMRELLVENGYLQEAGVDEPAITTPDHVYDLVQRAISGERIVPADEVEADTQALASDERRYQEDELEYAEQAYVLTDIAEADKEFGDTGFRDLYLRMPREQRIDVITRVRNGEDTLDVIEDMVARGDDLQEFAGMAMRRGLTDEQTKRLRDMVAEQAPDMLDGFDELVASIPKRKPRKKKSVPAGDERLDENKIVDSVTDTHLVSLIDGKRYKELKRHLQNNGMTPDQYRDRFSLPDDYPMVHPSLAIDKARKDAANTKLAPALQSEARNRVGRLEDRFSELRVRLSTGVLPTEQGSAGDVASDETRGVLPGASSMAAMPSRRRRGAQDDQGSLTEADPKASMKMGSARIDMLNMQSDLRPAEGRKPVRNLQTLMKMKKDDLVSLAVTERVPVKSRDTKKQIAEKLVGSPAPASVAAVQEPTVPVRIQQIVNRLRVIDSQRALNDAVEELTTAGGVTAADWKAIGRVATGRNYRSGSAARDAVVNNLSDGLLLQDRIGRVKTLFSPQEQSSALADVDLVADLNAAFYRDMGATSEDLGEWLAEAGQLVDQIRKLPVAEAIATANEFMEGSLSSKDKSSRAAAARQVYGRFLSLADGKRRAIATADRSAGFAPVLEAQSEEELVAPIMSEVDMAIRRAASVMTPARIGLKIQDRIDLLSLSPNVVLMSNGQAPITASPEFQNWFRDSKVVDEDGAPLIVFHGSNADIVAFDADKQIGGALGSGFYFAENSQDANDFGSVTYPVYLNIKNPLILSDLSETNRQKWNNLFEDDPFVASEQVREIGHDGIFDDVYSDRTWLAFEPTQIKSAISNRGAFDPNDPRIAYSISAFHGSPASFDLFDTSKAGTGEGLSANELPGAHLTSQAETAKEYSEDVGDGQGNVYAVTINAEENELIDSSATLEDQSDYIKERLPAEFTDEVQPNLAKDSFRENMWNAMHAGNRAGFISRGEDGKWFFSAKTKEGGRHVEKADTVEEAADKFEAWYKDKGPRPTVGNIISYLGGARSAELLEAAGIKGTKTAVETSHGPAATYIIIDDAVLEITAKNGKAATAKARKGVIDQMFSLRGFYSPAIQAMEGIKQKKGSGQQFLAQIKKAPGVRRDELDWMGLEEFLQSKSSFTKDEVLEFMRAHQIQLDEVELGDTITAEKVLTEVSAEQVLLNISGNENWFTDAVTIWTYKIGDHDPYYITQNDDPRDGLFAIFDEDGSQVEGNPINVLHAQQLLDGIHAEFNDAPGLTKFEGYKVPGGENYRELLIRLPELGEKNTPEDHAELMKLSTRQEELREIERQNGGVMPDAESKELLNVQARAYQIHLRGRPVYKSQHFKDQEIVHLRVDDRRGPNGTKILFINEIQEDLWQTAQRFGFGEEGLAKATAVVEGRSPEMLFAAKEFIAEKEGVSVEQVEEKYGFRDESDYLTVATNRYQFEGFVEGSEAAKTATRRYRAAEKYVAVFTSTNGAPKIPFTGASGLELGLKRALLYAVEGGYDAISWARSDQIAEAVGGSAEDLAVQYDQKIGRFLNKYTKKWGGEVGEKDIGIGDEVGNNIDVSTMNDEQIADAATGLSATNQILQITPAMRESVLEGQPLAVSRPETGRRPTIEGMFDREKLLITISRAALDPVGAFHHEAVHALRTLGLFSDQEWSVLHNAAKSKGWLNVPEIASYQKIYGKKLSDSNIIEEGVAMAFQRWMAEGESRSSASVIDKLFVRIQQFFERALNAFAGAGFIAADDVFNAIQSGAVADRDSPIGQVVSEIEGAARGMLHTAGRVPDSPRRAPRTPGLDKPGEGLAQLIRRFNRSLGLTVRAGRLDPALIRKMGSGLRGQAGVTTGVVRLKIMNELDTLAHEGGHVLEFRFKSALDRVKMRFDLELNAIASPGANQLSEGFAEFFRRYITNRKAARRVAPGFYGAFEKFLREQDPALFEKLQRVEIGYQEWLAAPSAGAVMSSIVSMAKRPLRDFKNTVKEGELPDAIRHGMDKLYTWVVDDLNPIRQTVNGLLEIARHNLNLKKSDYLALKAVNDPYILARLARDGYAGGHMNIMNGVRGYHQTEFVGASVHDALTTAFGGRKSGWNEAAKERFDAYLIARRMIQEWDRFARGELDRMPDKFRKSEHEETVAQLEAAFPQFKAAASQVYEYQNNMLQLKLGAGLISQEVFDILIGRLDYVPAMRDRSDLGQVHSGAMPRADKMGILKRFGGSQRDVISPLEMIIQDSYDTSMMIARNDMILALDRLARAAGPGAGRFAERVPASEMKGTRVNVQEAITSAARDAGVDPADLQIMIQAVDDQLGDNAITTIWRAGEINEKGEAIVYLWENGKRIPIRLADKQMGKEMLEAITGIGQDLTPWYVAGLALPATILRTSITASLDFIGANYFRDQISAWILVDKFKPFITGARGIYDDLSGADIGKLYASVGGIMGGANVATLHNARIKQEVLDLRKRRGIYFRDAPLNNILRMTEFTETGTRLGIFRLAMERAKADGLSDYEATIEAAFAARDYIDFGRHGSKMLVLRRIIPFWNAALQGLDRGIRGLRGKVKNDRLLRTAISPYIKTRTGQPLTAAERRALPLATKVWSKMVAIGMFGLMLSLLYKDDPEYEEFSEYMRATHWIFKDGNGGWIRAPIPFELGTFSALFQRTFEYTYKDDPDGLERFIRSLQHTVIPPFDATGIKLPAELMANYDFFRDRQIVGNHLQRLPAHLQFNAYASELGKRLGKIAGVSPAMIDHTITGLFASYGRTALKISDSLAEKNYEGGGQFGLDALDAFILRRFTVDPARGALSTQKFWELVGYSGGKFTQAAEGYKNYIKQQNDPLGAAEFLATLNDEEKAFAILSQSQTERNSKFRKIHPLIRAQQTVGIANSLRKGLNLDRLDNTETKERMVISPSMRREAITILTNLQMREARNALIATQVPGWKQRKIMPVDGVMKELEAAAPPIFEEYERRRTKAKLPSFEDVLTQWPDARKEILEQGADAALIEFYEPAQ